MVGLRQKSTIFQNMVMLHILLKVMKPCADLGIFDREREVQAPFNPDWVGF